jgi:hypothetical protein
MSSENPSPDEIARRSEWFRNYVGRLDARPGQLPLRCPCCGCKTLSQRAAYQICVVCFWEDDGQDDHDAEIARGGPNGSLSLSAARANYQRIGACAERYVCNVRPPTAAERPDTA